MAKQQDGLFEKGKSVRGEQLRLLTAVKLPLARMKMLLRAIDDIAREKTTAYVTFYELAKYMGVKTEKTVRRAVQDFVRRNSEFEALLIFEKHGARYIVDVDRRHKERRDTETTFRAQINWIELRAFYERQQNPASPEGQEVRPKRQNVQPKGQDVLLTSLAHFQTPPSSQSLMEDEISNRLDDADRVLEGIANRGVPPDEVLVVIREFDRRSEERPGIYKPGLLHRWLATLRPGKKLDQLWDPNASRTESIDVVARRDYYRPMLEALDQSELNRLATYARDGPDGVRFWSFYKNDPSVYDATIDPLIEAYLEFHDTGAAASHPSTERISFP